ncbi:hypothetical protein N9B67_00600 [Algibacter sp.]|nr:hypothetical protein [Algibacter sp.]
MIKTSKTNLRGSSYLYFETPLPIGTIKKPQSPSNTYYTAIQSSKGIPFCNACYVSRNTSEKPCDYNNINHNFFTNHYVLTDTTSLNTGFAMA